MEMMQGVWKQDLRPRAVVGYGVKIFLPSPPNYVTRSPGVTSFYLFSGKLEYRNKIIRCNTSIVRMKMNPCFAIFVCYLIPHLFLPEPWSG